MGGRKERIVSAIHWSILCFDGTYNDREWRLFLLNKGFLLGIFLWILTMVLLFIQGCYDIGVGVYIGAFEFAIACLLGWCDDQ